METVAAELGMTSRSPRRHLENEGTSYRQLIDEIREILAEPGHPGRYGGRGYCRPAGLQRGVQFYRCIQTLERHVAKTHRVSLAASGRVLRPPNETRLADRSGSGLQPGLAATQSGVSHSDGITSNCSRLAASRPAGNRLAG